MFYGSCRKVASLADDLPVDAGDPSESEPLAEVGDGDDPLVSDPPVTSESAYVMLHMLVEEADQSEEDTDVGYNKREAKSSEMAPPVQKKRVRRSAV